MTTSSLMPSVVVEIAFNAGYSTPVGSRSWTDVSSYVELKEGVTIGYGRSDEFGVTDANSLSLTLDNKDGRFTAGKTGGAYYPNVKIGRPIRVTSTPVGGAASVRFLGYVDEWPVAWDGTDNYAKAQITARSRMARLGFDAEMGSVIETGFLAADPYLYFPLQEAEGSVAAYPVDGAASPLVPGPAGGAPPVFGSPGLVEGQTSVLFDSGFPDTDYLYALLGTPVVASSSLDLVIEGFVKPSNVDGNIITLHTSAGLFVGGLGLYLDAGDLKANYSAVTTTTAVSFDEWHHVAVAMTDDGFANTLDLYLDGVLVDTGSQATGTVTLTGMLVGQIQGSIAHVSVGTDVAGIADRAAAGLSGFNGDTATERIERYAAYAGVPSAEVDGDTDTQTVSAIDTAGSTALDAMRKVEATEGGVLFDARDNTLTFHSRARRYNTPSAFTFNVALQEVETDITPKLDRSSLVNDVTATATDGRTSRAINQTSIDDYGYARQTLDIASSSDAAYQAAAWRVALYAEPQPRIPALGVNLLPLSTARQDDLFELDIASHVTLSNQPTQAPATTSDYFIEGYTETIGHESYQFVFNVSPRTTAYEVWTIEDPVYGAYDTYGLAY